ncbi:MAG: hypothetical protein PHP50_14365 [Lachnospiraceae bacterium]|nr:hypothetical protein [Lachnospiraceae bacterium]
MKKELLKEKEVLFDQISRIDFMMSGGIDESYLNYHAIIKETPEGIIYAKEYILKDYQEYFDVIPCLGE